MYPRLYNPILLRNNFIWIELSGPPIVQAMNPLRLEIQNMFVIIL